jgi:hypothetical protein
LKYKKHQLRLNSQLILKYLYIHQIISHCFREITIPGDVLDDERLSDGAKLMYGKIARLAFKNGYCWAGNSFLDGTKTGRNASRFIAELKNSGYITIENEGSKLREIRICPIDSRLNNSTSPKMAKLNSQPDQLSEDNPASSGGVNFNSPDNFENSTSPNVAGLNPQPRQIRQGNLAVSGDVHLAKNGDRTLQDSTNLLNTAAAAPQPNTDPPPAEIPAAAAAITPKGLKTALQAVDKALILSKPFYPKAAAFMARYGLPEGYLKWLYRQCELKKPVSFNGLFFTLFFAENMAEQYKAAHQPAAVSPPPDINCPVCGAPHAPLDDTCPSCGLPKDSPAIRIELFQKLRKIPPEQREEYFRREQALGNECNSKDFVKYHALLTGLRKEFGLETA